MEVLQGKVNVASFFSGDESYKDYMSLLVFKNLDTIDDYKTEACRLISLDKREADVLRKG
jgi:hypothetical protein